MDEVIKKLEEVLLLAKRIEASGLTFDDYAIDEVIGTISLLEDTIDTFVVEKCLEECNTVQ